MPWDIFGASRDDSRLGAARISRSGSWGAMRYNEKELQALSRQQAELAAELGMRGPKKGSGERAGDPGPRRAGRGGIGVRRALASPLSVRSGEAATGEAGG